MTLKEIGHRFCVSPDRTKAQWLHPTIWQTEYADWIDTTDMSDSEFLEFLTETP